MNVWELIDKLSAALGKVRPVTVLWTHRLDAEWELAVNGSSHAQVWKGWELPPFCTAVRYNGWPAGLIRPGSGQFADGAEANFDAFMAAMQRKIDKLQHAA